MSVLTIGNTKIRFSKIESITFNKNLLQVEIDTVSGRTYSKKFKTEAACKKVIEEANNAIDLYEST